MFFSCVESEDGGDREIREEQCQDGWLINSLSPRYRSQCSGLRLLLCWKSGTANQGFQIRKEGMEGKKERKHVEYIWNIFSLLGGTVV